MLCNICNEKESKYTCPKCKFKYCSLVCFKSEKHIEMDDTALSKAETSKPVQDENIGDNNNNEEEEKPKGENQKEIDDPMLKELVKNPQFLEYMASPVLQYHILTILEILNNVSLTNEYSKDGRLEIASRKLNNLRSGGIEENSYVDEFINWFFNWLDNYKNQNKNQIEC
jgi:hypothetical protein